MFTEDLNFLTVNTDALGLTEEEFFNFCQQNKNLRMERDKEQNIIFMSPLGTLSGYFESLLNKFVSNWNEHSKFGYVFSSSTGFTLPNGAIRSPDVAWIKKEQWEKIPMADKKKFAHLCPDFIIELRSESDSLKTLKNKMQEWIENGCRLGWLIDFENKNVFIYRPDKPVDFINSFNKKNSGEDVLPGFELDLSQLK